MTKEAKVGLLLGLLLIIGIAVILRGVHRDPQEQTGDELRQIAQNGAAPSPNSGVSQGVQRLAARTQRPATGRNQAPSGVRPTSNRTFPATPAPAPRVARANPSAQSSQQSTLSANRSYTPSSVPAVRTRNSGQDVRYSGPLPSSSNNTSSNDSHGVIRPFPSAIDRAAEQVQAATSRSSTAPTVYTSANSTPAPSAPATPSRSTSAAPARSRVYAVRQGDDLSRVALEVYGQVEGRRWVNVVAIYEANRDVLTSMDVLRVGQSLRIPPLTATTVSDSSASAGTVDAISQVTRRAATASATNEQVYVVREGDSLWKIAQRQLGDGSRHNEILELNRDRLSDDGSNVRVGMRLRMPAGTVADQPAVASTARQTASNSSARRNYTVREGDSLWKIAQQQLGSGERYHEITELNADILSDENSLPAGLVLRLP